MFTRNFEKLSKCNIFIALMKGFLFGLLLLISLPSFAQLNKNYTQYSVENGLSQNSVWDALQDHRGFLWIGTADGINRFDGYKMHFYGWKEGDSTSLGGSTGFTFYEDSLKQLWVSHDRGLDVYNRIKDNFIRLHQTGISECVIGEYNGTIYTASYGKYIFGYDRRTLKLKFTLPINAPWHNYPGAQMLGVQINHNLFIGTSGNVIVQFSAKSNQVKYHHIDLKNHVTPIKLDSKRFCTIFKNKAYIMTLEGDSLFVKQVNYAQADTPLFNFTGGRLYNGVLYASGFQGLFSFDPESLKYQGRETNFGSNQSETFQYIQQVNSDNNNNLILCSNGGGLYIYSPYRNKFKHFTNYHKKNSLFKSVVKLPDGRIFAGCYDNGLTEFDSMGRFNIIKQLGGIKLNTVAGLYPKSKNELWIIANNRLGVMNLTTKKLWINEKVDLDYGYPFPHFGYVNGRLLVNFSSDKNSALQDVETGKIAYNLNINFVTTFKEISDSILLLGTDHGLFVLNKITKAIRGTEIKKFVKSILVYSSNDLYIGTITGLYHTNANYQVKKLYNKNNGLVNEFIYVLMTDKYNRIWFSHNKGLSVLNTKLETFTHYGVNDGLQSNEFNTGAFYKADNGLLLFGGVNGINEINVDQIKKNNQAPRIAINQILLGDIPYKSDTAYNELKSLTLGYLDNTLSFDFSALDFSKPESNTYQYKLDGFDLNWIESETKHFARYANLPPGEYVFKIMAANGDGVWNKEPREISITIVPPFWKRTWFYVFIVGFSLVLIVAIIYSFFRWQHVKLKRELEINQKLEFERQRISRDLHDNVGAQLSYLISNVEWMLAHPEGKNELEETQRLKALSETGRNAILTLRQTIWAISNTELSLEDFADRFKQFALKMIEFDEGIHLHFSEEFRNNSTLSPANALHVFRICQESFNNSLKHSKCKNIHISFFSSLECAFQFVLEDDGTGFNWEQAKKNGHYGLVNMESRAHEIGANFIVESNIGSGTRIEVSLN